MPKLTNDDLDNLNDLCTGIGDYITGIETELGNLIEKQRELELLISNFEYDNEGEEE